MALIMLPGGLLPALAKRLPDVFQYRAVFVMLYIILGVLQPRPEVVVWAAVSLSLCAREGVGTFLWNKEQQVQLLTQTEPMLSPIPNSDKITFCCSLDVLQNSGGNQTILKIAV